MLWQLINSAIAGWQWEMPEYLKALDVVAVLGDTLLQHHTSIRDSASEVANWGGGTSF